MLVWVEYREEEKGINIHSEKNLRTVNINFYFIPPLLKRRKGIENATRDF